MLLWLIRERDRERERERVKEEQREGRWGKRDIVIGREEERKGDGEVSNLYTI